MNNSIVSDVVSVYLSQASRTEVSKVCILFRETDRHFCANLNTFVCVLKTHKAPGPAQRFSVQTSHTVAKLQKHTIAQTHDGTIMQTCIRSYLAHFAEIFSTKHNLKTLFGGSKRVSCRENAIFCNIFFPFSRSLSLSLSFPINV